MQKYQRNRTKDDLLAGFKLIAMCAAVYALVLSFEFYCHLSRMSVLFLIIEVVVCASFSLMGWMGCEVIFRSLSKKRMRVESLLDHARQFLRPTIPIVLNTRMSLTSCLKVSRQQLIYVVLAVMAALFLGFVLSHQVQVFPGIESANHAAMPKEVSVQLSEAGFAPKEVTIKVGTAIRWKNVSGTDQTVNSDDYPTNQKHRELNFGVFPVGSSFMHVFDRPGTYGYHNQLRPEQHGTIIVKP